MTTWTAQGRSRLVAAPAPGAASGAPFLTSIAGTGTGQYLADAAGNPWMLRGDTVWGLIDNAGQNGGATTWQTDISSYCATRAGQGFNTVFSTPVGTTQSGAQADNGDTWDGVAPFTSPGVLNSTFWTRVDYLITTAASYGLTVILNAMFTYAMDTAGAPLDTSTWTDTDYQAYGAALGARYASTPNLAWEAGDDYTLAYPYGGYDTHFSAFLTGLRGAGDNHLISIENTTETSSRYADDGSLSYAWGIANAQYTWVYSYNAAYDGVESAYTETSPIAVCKMDGWYDGESSPTESQELFMRKWAWWSLSSGARGTLYGRQALFPWPADSLSILTTNAFDNASLGTIWDTFASLPGWHQLVPDTSSALVTAGRGTHAAQFSPGAVGSAYTGGNTYVTASITASGSLAVIYIPAHATITVNGSLMTSGYTASWVDPASGAATSATIASTYNSTGQGNNSAGDPDWLLVLRGP